jgi:hypothetical protein
VTQPSDSKLYATVHFSPPGTGKRARVHGFGAPHVFRLLTRLQVSSHSVAQQFRPPNMHVYKENRAKCGPAIVFGQMTRIGGKVFSRPTFLPASNVAGDV